jgi:hypothetical protein
MSDPKNEAAFQLVSSWQTSKVPIRAVYKCGDVHVSFRGKVSLVKDDHRLYLSVHGQPEHQSRMDVSIDGCSAVVTHADVSVELVLEGKASLVITLITN